MSKKMKGVVAFESSARVSHEDVRARIKHQTLLQDYLELQQETEAARNKLEARKQKKQTLEAEIRFLRRRHRFLMKTKASTSEQVKSTNVETIQYWKNKKEKANPKKSTALSNLPPLYNQNHKRRVYTGKKNAVPRRTPLVFDLDKNVDLQRVPGNNLSTQKDGGFSGKEAVRQTRATVFDLNQISIEEDEEEEVQESFDGQRKERNNDLKLSICRNIGDGSTNRSGKRKIAWQDPVALRV